MKYLLTFFVYSLLCFSQVFSSDADHSVCNVTWADVADLSAKAADVCKAKPMTWKGILIVTRGGLIPGGLLVQHLNIKNIRVICLESYTNEKKTSDIHEIYRPTDIENDGDGWIVVDELVDSGRSLEYIRKIYPKAFYVALFAKPDGKKAVDVSMRDCEQNTWLVFPWE